MIYDGYLPPLRNTGDIPIHRDSVLAMGFITTAPSFKPYVYRGWDVDLFTDLPPVRRPTPPAPPRKRRQPRSRPSSLPVAPSPDRDLIVAEAAAREAQAMLAEFAAKVDKPKRVKAKKEKKRKKPKPAKPVAVRPSAGWRPTSGADIDALLAEFDA